MTIERAIDHGGTIEIVEDGRSRFAPKDTANRDYRLVKTWEAMGGTIEAAPPAVTPTPEERIDEGLSRSVALRLLIRKGIITRAEIKTELNGR